MPPAVPLEAKAKSTAEARVMSKAKEKVDRERVVAKVRRVETSRLLLEHILAHPTMSKGQRAADLGVSDRTITSTMQVLLANELITTVQASKGGHAAPTSSVTAKGRKALKDGTC